MAEVIETTVYPIDELNTGARETARSWYLDEVLSDSAWWYEEVFEDFTQICRILGITLDRRSNANDTESAENNRPWISFQGFSTQGDGACFQGSWRYRKGCKAGIREYAPLDNTLHDISDRLIDVQKRNFYQLGAAIKSASDMQHEYGMSFEVGRDNNMFQTLADGTEKAVSKAMRDLARWLYQELREAYESAYSDETMTEMMTVNNWKFTKKGKYFPRQ